ncbi:hypothetical protein Trydic_g22338 [Trypoxylus dichotomus]
MSALLDDGFVAVAKLKDKHGCLAKSKEIVKIGWKVLYIPDLESTDFHLFEPLKETHHGIQFEVEETVKSSVRQWLKKQDRGFYHTAIHALLNR